MFQTLMSPMQLNLILFYSLRCLGNKISKQRNYFPIFHYLAIGFCCLVSSKAIRDTMVKTMQSIRKRKRVNTHTQAHTEKPKTRAEI